MSASTLTLEMIVMLSLLAVTVWLFAFSIVRVDVAALCILVFLALSTYVPLIEPLLPRDEVFSGFSSNAVMSIIAVMIIGGGLDRTGVMNHIAALILKRGGRVESRIQILLSGAAAFVSAFMQNIGVAALFLPVANRISKRTGIPVSRLLMPMGFCVILGGTATMIGASPLILLNDLLISTNRTLPEADQMAPFSLFDTLPVGLALTVAGLLYFRLAGGYLLPADTSGQAIRSSRTSAYFESVYGIKGELFEVLVERDSPLAGLTLNHIDEHYENAPFILALYGGDVTKIPPSPDETVWVGTRLGLMGERHAIEAFCAAYDWTLLGEPDEFADVLNPRDSGIAEIVIPPGSSLVGKRIGEIKPRRNFGTNILQIYRADAIIRHGFRDTDLHPGDTLVVHGSWKDLYRLRDNRDVIVASDVSLGADADREAERPEKSRQALTFFFLSLALFLYSNNLAISLWIGALGMILTRVLSIEEAYGSISWSTVFVLAGLIPLGRAMDGSGTAEWIAQAILALIGDVPAWVMQTVVAGLATFFTLVMSNVGATVLLVPLAVNLALSVGADPALFAMTVAISTSNTFLIPTNQVNALILGPGGYKVADFMRVGGGMTVIFLVVSVVVLDLTL